MKQKKTSSKTTGIYLGGWRLIPAVFLIALGMITKITIGGVDLAGNTALTALGAAIIFWPILRELAVKGGSANIFGLELKFDQLKEKTEKEIQNIERETEGSLGVRVVELSADIEDLGAKFKKIKEKKEIHQFESDDLNIAKEYFDDAVSEYRNNRSVVDGWRGRVDVDKKLTTINTRLPFVTLKELFEKNKNDQEICMAIAVSLGIRGKDEDIVGIAELLHDLLSSHFERVRFRAARSVERLARRIDTPRDAIEILEKGISEAMKNEQAKPVLQAFESASLSLSWKSLV